MRFFPPFLYYILTKNLRSGITFMDYGFIYCIIFEGTKTERIDITSTKIRGEYHYTEA